MSTANQEQAEFWSEQGGRTWSQNDAFLDESFADVLAHLLEVASLQPGENVLDIGCGTGLSTIRAGQAVGAHGSATGADIAEQTLTRAREQSAEMNAQNVSFQCADAQSHAFAQNHHDAVISRFGVMFFADPVAAFANIASGVKPGGRMIFMTWGSVKENPWFSVPRDVAVARLGPVEPTPPNAPGPMGLSDRAYTEDVFKRAGLVEVSITSVAIDLTPPGSASDLGEFATRLGPASRILMEKDGTESDKTAIVEGVTERFKAYETTSGMRVPAMFNRIEARVA